MAAPAIGSMTFRYAFRGSFTDTHDCFGYARHPVRPDHPKSPEIGGDKPVTIQATDAVLLDIHERMVRIRIFEEEAGKLMENGKVPGALHLYVGQEAVAAGVMAHLEDSDHITSTHRGHGHVVAKGGQFNEMYAELYGKAAGYCKGRGGSMHICNMEIGMLGANGIVGGGIPIAMGAAFSKKFRKTKEVAASFFGDGASNEGSFHEAANMAALYKLPLILVCENNGFGEYTRQDNHQAIVDVADRAAGYGMPGVVVDGMDAIAVYEAAGEAVARARNGEGPTLLECKTYRFYDHVGVRGMGLSYRTDEEVDAWKQRDPIKLIEEKLIEQGIITKRKISAIHKRIREEAMAAIKFAEDSPLPDPDGLLEDVYYVQA